MKSKFSTNFSTPSTSCSTGIIGLLTSSASIPDISKEITRRQFLEALHNYQFWLVEPIIELARIKFTPLKITYGLKHGTRDLPVDIVKEIESLHVVKSLDDLSNKIEEVKAMTNKYK